MPLFLGNPGTPISERDLRKIEAPPATASWHPIPHYLIASCISRYLASFNFSVPSVRHYTSAADHVYMGIYDLNIPLSPDPALDYGLIVQSSTNKSLPIRITFGASLRLCSNGCVFGSNIQSIRRKHTIARDEIESSLAEKVLPILHSFTSDLRTFHARNTLLRTVDAPVGPHLSDTLIKAAQSDLIAPDQILRVLEYFNNPSLMTNPLPVEETLDEDNAPATEPLATDDEALSVYAPGSLFCLQQAFSASYRSRLSPQSALDRLHRLSPFLSSFLPNPSHFQDTPHDAPQGTRPPQSLLPQELP
jgi:hypothetical protein